MADPQQELASIFGRSTKRVRTTQEHPRRVSVIDVAVIVTGRSASNAARDIGTVKERYPDITENMGAYKFPGRGQKSTVVATVRGIVETVMHCGARCTTYAESQNLRAAHRTRRAPQLTAARNHPTGPL